MKEVTNIVSETAVSIDKIRENIKFNSLKYKEIDQLDDFREHVPIAIVGGGPSLNDTYIELYDFNPRRIMACGSVHDFLVEKGIIPRWCVVVDPDPVILGYIKYPRKETKYLVSSQCDPEIFEYLKDYDVTLWHAYGDALGTDSFNKNSILIGGGCTVGTRAIIIAAGFGYNVIHLYGIDSCLTDDYKHHAYNFIDSKKETVGNITEIRLDYSDSPTFKVADYMLAQLFDFKSILQTYSKRLKFISHGNGLITYLLKISQEKAMKNGN